MTVILPTPVDPTRAFLVFSVSEDAASPADGQVSGTLTATAVTFARVGGTGTVTVKYYVAEFSSGVSVRRGSADLSVGSPVNVTLSPAVDTARSFPLISYRITGTDFDGNDLVRAKITSGSNLRLSYAGAAATAPQVVEWQVVEYQGANVQTGDSTFGGGNGSVAAPLTAVNIGKSWLVYSYECDASGCPGPDPNVNNKLVRGVISTTTTLSFDRTQLGPGLLLTWYLVEFTDATTVQSASEPFTTAETVRNVTLASPAPPGLSIAAGGGDYQRGGRSPYSANDNPGVGWFTLDLTGSENLRITRGTTGGGTATADLGWFVVTFAQGGCSSLTTTQNGAFAGGYRVVAPASCELEFAYPGGGGIHRLWDLAEDPWKTSGRDLGGGGTAAKQPSLWSDELGGVAGTNYQSGRNLTGSKTIPLEVTGTRVKMRQEAFFQGPDTGPILAGVKGTGDYTVYPTGRMALHWVRRYTNTAAINYTFQQLQTVTRFEAPFDTWLTYTDNGVTPPARASPPKHTFVLSQTEKPEARTDVLTILARDWAAETSSSAISDGITGLFLENFWSLDVPGSVAAGSPPETWDFLFYFKPTNLVDHNDPAVLSRRDDYRSPDPLSVTVGNPWIDAAQNTAAGDDFNEAEGAYLLTMDPNPGQGLRFEIDGNATPRYKPFFKIRQWRSFIDAPVVTLEGTRLTKDVNYKADVKPVSQAHLAQPASWHSTLQNDGAVTSPDIGGAGSVSGGPSFVPARYGNGASITASTQYVAFPTSDFDKARGAVEFWYQPTWDSADGVWHDICGFSDGLGNVFVLEKPDVGNTLDFILLASGTFSRLRVAATDYSWRAGDWVHIRLEWDATLPLATQQRLFLNGAEPTHTDPTNDYNSANLTVQTEFKFGNVDGQYGNTTFAPGLFDEIHVYGGSSTTPARLAHGGLTADANEYLADTAKDYSLAFTAVDGARRGTHLYLGADSPFQGLNVSLQTPGVWSVAGDLIWEYWNGTQWATLESGYGFTDETDDLTRRGTIYWTGDPATWSPYSVNGGPDLYYVRAYLSTGASYATAPVENVIKTDILLFQYCGDITAAAQEFVFGPPFRRRRR